MTKPPQHSEAPDYAAHAFASTRLKKGEIRGPSLSLRMTGFFNGVLRAESSTARPKAFLRPAIKKA